ncbi:signal recognition particle-docking protein FtsY [Tissierella creatinophila]|uniref:Signal recognition particle receptor FtsY n=1 Tax=Tissierella creatinophila DSM 6911 TaxID=1123403 RepID=A0A1U7M382_TISCR|nr:signal recognition particle-docking protein FtsY [Tissierella creatinophila]OLS01735.1 signal recognition particle receptor FtsY [Tissierella creatinophila DSM 6911]
MFNWFNKDKNKKEKKQKEVEKGEIIEEFKNKNIEESQEDIVIEEDKDFNLDLKETEESIEYVEKEVENEKNIETLSDVGIEEIEEKDFENEKKGFLGKLFGGLSKTRKEMSDKISAVLSSYKKIDEELFEDLEEILVTADVGVNTTMDLIDRIRERVKREKINNPEIVKDLLKDEIKLMMKESVKDNSLNIEPSPAVMLVVGVNGVGKTTTIGKLSNNFKKDGKKVLIAAADTFRAAAIEQLEEWSNRSGVEFIAHKEGADPAAVIFDGIHAAKARKTDILICDTAGRLHNKSNLMQELNKIFRIVEREYGDATKEVLLVLDATTGQNAINQAKVFKEVAHITGVALTKLDGTAKGGVVIALQSELGLPIKLIGVGEGIDDLQEFNSNDFVDALFE